MSTGRPATSVSTHVLDTALGRPAGGVAVELSAAGAQGGWTALGGSVTDADGRCEDLPAPPADTTRIRLRFEVGPYLSGRAGAGTAFFPEVTVDFTVAPGEHHHVPLLLSPYGYSVYRGS
ncbi:hydroxyisourate hydrolase [Streptomyces albireticuli]|uniref:5-hydroxyisourate hydrolase n=1 Tax=Streptomyces albireticuli TaxID=1940 RepID=A0A2A2CZJ3_9ACTN|nr:hydroxyisourate hydrolase [Streptomyces albireticuli]MCD9140704.1 hydroxyisourate hydrolase [Streptomyces albireticuli]MCD9161334.1 hydroxyisourate hydrolase [Streptomyces albireticuli]MCD9190608.1 hydroxyisourate hydrolase [Streptomyces albireticuli]PAU44586.1 hydroxyisourate hydrolase [Streptomyces albireticuli]